MRAVTERVDLADARRSEAVMACGRIVAPRTASLERTSAPSPGHGEVRVRIEGCGVCGSHETTWAGRPWFRYPLEPGATGHEGWGFIDALGHGVEGLVPGQRVALLSYHAFAEQDVAPATSVVPLPPELDDTPFPGEALGCAMNVHTRADIRPGQTVAVIGVGFLGALLIQLAAKDGARVIAISRRPFSLAVAARCGAEETLPLTPDAARRILERTDGRGCERVIEAVGHQSTLDLATDTIGEGGRLVIAGYHQDGRRAVDLQTWNWRGIDVINAHERDPARYVEGMRAAVDAVVEGRLDIEPWITHRMPLASLGEALDLLASRPDGFLKSVVLP